ncbi:hypothetical protein SDC9_170408 [bioreactor metagenome]|uniref:Uncharacterized protein n=1 Tax=bioreactor metagenome TaxID=1076179 RepID=A0A645GH04_9ZZZZ
MDNCNFAEFLHAVTAGNEIILAMQPFAVGQQFGKRAVRGLQREVEVFHLGFQLRYVRGDVGQSGIFRQPRQRQAVRQRVLRKQHEAHQRAVF